MKCNAIFLHIRLNPLHGELDLIGSVCSLAFLHFTNSHEIFSLICPFSFLHPHFFLLRALSLSLSLHSCVFVCLLDSYQDDSKGRFISKDGSIYVGPFHRGRMHGVGVLVENGLTYNVVYENGVLKSKERADPPDSSQRRSRDFEHTREERDLSSGASQSDKVWFSISTLGEM